MPELRIAVSLVLSAIFWINASASLAQPLQKQTLIDKNGFERPIPAFHIDVPRGWQVTGGVVWKQIPCTSMANQLEWQASAPDSPAQIVFFPMETWSWSSLLDEMPQLASSNGGCPAARVFDARSYLQLVLQYRRPGVRIIGMRPRPDAVQELQALYGNMGQQYGMQLHFDAVEALIAYQMNGVEMRESLMTIIQLTKTAMPDLNGGMSGYLVSGQSLGVFGMKAPNGQLDFNLMEQVRRSMTIDPAYNKRMAAYHARMNRARSSSRGSSASAQAKLNKTYSEIGDIIHNGYQDRSVIGDSLQEQTTDMILEQQGYINMTGDVVKLPNGYDRTFELNNGDFVQTDDQFFDPYRDLGLDGTEIQQQQY